MMLLRALRTEFRKALTLPGAWAGMAVAVLGSVGIAALNAMSSRNALAAGDAERFVNPGSPFESAYAAVPLGTVGAVVVGVILISSEYAANSNDASGGRQITATLTTMPRRLVVLLTKSLTLLFFVALTVVLAVPVSIAVAGAIIGEFSAETVSLEEALRRILGAGLYWALSGLMALSITVFVRSGTIPLLVLVLTNSMVSISFLLTRITPLAFWLPDLAGRKLFEGLDMIPGGLEPVPGALVMSAWTVALLVAAGVVFARRDA